MLYSSDVYRSYLQIKKKCSKITMKKKSFYKLDLLATIIPVKDAETVIH